jgi:pyruvate,water dikinase
LDIFKIVPRISILLKRLPDVPSSETGNLEKIIQWNAKCFYLHIKCTAYSIGAFAMLSHYLYKWIPSEAQAMITLILTGNESLQTAEQGMTIWEICNFIRNRPALLDIINKESDWIRLSDEVVKVDGGAECLGMLYEFLQKNGARAAEEFELAVPRWKEAPGFILDVMRSYLAIPVRESNAEDIFARRRNRDKAVNNISRSLSRIQRIIFKKLLSSYADFCTLRENIKYQLMEGYFIIRMNILDIGAQMVLGNILDNKNDIFFMRLSEIKGILKNEKFYCNPKDLISERKAQHKIWKSQHTPDLILQDGMPLQTINDSNSLLKGIGCSPGIVEGYARVLKNISEMRDLKHGEILVTSHTDPGWTPLFLSCKGLVTETGGFLSHGATVAREYGLPAVVSVPSATEKIQTGHYLIVDGNRGLVTITSMK